MVLTEQEWKMVYAAMKMADAIVMDPMFYHDDKTFGHALVLHSKERMEALFAAKQNLREVSELPHKWRELMEHFHGMFVEAVPVLHGTFKVGTKDTTDDGWDFVVKVSTNQTTGLTEIEHGWMKGGKFAEDGYGAVTLPRELGVAKWNQ